MLGTVQKVLVCIPGDSVSPIVCPSGTVPATVNAFLIDEVAQHQLEASLAPIDYAVASVYWGLAFSVILVVWSLGQLFSYARRAIR